MSTAPLCARLCDAKTSFSRFPGCFPCRFPALSMVLLAFWSLCAFAPVATAQTTASTIFGSATPAVPGDIYTVAGNATNGSTGPSGDGGPATSASLLQASGVAIDSHGNLYISEFQGHRVRKVTPAGIISTIAGNGTAGYAGDGGAATSAELRLPSSITFDSQDNLYISDTGNNVIRKVTAAGVITTVAGGGPVGTLGDGGPATSAYLHSPEGLAFDKSGNLYISDEFNFRIRKVTPAGIISTVVGNGTFGFAGDGGQATSAELHNAIGIAIDSNGNLLIADQQNYRIRRVTADGVINTVAGSSAYLTSGDGGPATSAGLQGPLSVVADGAGNLYIADEYRIRKVDAAGIITTVAGGGTGFIPDKVPATSVQLFPFALAFDSQGSLLISNNALILELALPSTLKATTTTLTSSAAMLANGAPETLTATVSYTSGTSVPTGTVTFLDGTTTLGTGTLNASGVATLNTSTLSVGTHLLTAQYGGDSTYGASTSQAISVVVTAVTAAPTTLSLTGPANGIVGQALKLNVLLAGTGTGTPTGNVVVSSSIGGGASMNVGTVSAASAFASGGTTLSFTPTVTGATTFTASYAGDPNFQASSSTLVATIGAVPVAPGSFTMKITNPISRQTPVAGDVSADVGDTMVLAVQSQNGFNQPLALSVDMSTLPSNVQVNFTDSMGKSITSVTPQANGTTDVNVQFTYKGAVGALSGPAQSGSTGGRQLALVGLPTLMAAILFSRRTKWRYSLRLFGITACFLYCLTLQGCQNFGCDSNAPQLSDVTVTLSPPASSGVKPQHVIVELGYDPNR